MKATKQKIIIIIALFAFSIISTLTSAGQKDKLKAEPNKYGIQKGKIIAEIPNENTVDVIIKEGKDLVFYSYEVIIQDKEYKEIYGERSVSSFNYGGFTITKDDPVKILKSNVEAHLGLGRQYYKHNYKNLTRHPYCGVSTSKVIYRLKVNNQPVEKIIKYKEEDQTFYIWYFSDITVKETADYTDLGVSLY